MKLNAHELAHKTTKRAECDAKMQAKSNRVRIEMLSIYQTKIWKSKDIYTMPNRRILSDLKKQNKPHTTTLYIYYYYKQRYKNYNEI